MTKNKIIYAIITLALCVSLAMTLVSCNTGDVDGDTDATNTTVSTEAEVNTEQETESASDGESTTLVESESESATESGESTSDVESESDTAAAESESNTAGGETEGTTEERFDYFAVDISQYASIDKSKYESFTLSVNANYEISEKDVDAYIADLCYDYRQAVNGSAKVTNKPTENGDVAYIFYKGIMDGEEFEGGSNMDESSPYALTIGSGTFIAGFEEALIGVVPNETSPENMVAINLTFPDDYHATEYAGRDVTFYVYISWIVEYEIPEYNESFIRDTLKYESDSEDIVSAHRAAILSYLVAESESQLKALKESHIWNSLIESMTVTRYPEGELEAYYDYYYAEIEYYYAYYSYMGMSFESIDDFAVQFLGLSAGADWKAEITHYAEEATRQTMSYHIIAKNEGLVLTEDDVNREIDAYIDYYKNYYNKEYTREEIIQNIGEIALKESALCTKVLDLLIVRVTVVYE